ncbi:hypothetical protein BBH99_00190 [Chryseobacterium contaminans]|uniref:Uncharacterized protein n=1 Tax=Chryseobacterium contaminans TaxID=1423959 RepID=A0A1M6VLW7_9FLAO|nr:hypothetical protein [Chryseobacterium contaminans]OCA80556.1 hypothetical protein BBH99_00190 [Chryseobacterium contaminans]SHK82449.1 hypothetical protein SAMN05444407_101271 [Chryseobacterium contaminans]
MKLELKAELSGSNINGATIYFEILPIDPHAIPLAFIRKKDGSKDLIIQNVKLLIDNELDFLLVINAFKGTKWTFTLTNVSSGKEVFKRTGNTGDDENYKPNYSVLKSSISIESLKTLV